MVIAPFDLQTSIKSYRGFFLEGHQFDSATGTISLNYRFTPDGPAFTEQIILGASQHPTAPDMDAFEKLLPLLHAVAGISYYKAYIPRTIEGATFTQEQEKFLTRFYREGLGEFAYRNNLNLEAHPFFNRAKDSASHNTGEIDLPERALVLVGGGKDSLVSIETLRHAQDDITLFAVNPAQPIKHCMDEAGLPTLTVTRRIDSRLFDENKNGAYNGHVPITGIISFIAAAAALWHGYNKIVLSNERSANEATVDGVNHQYSKSQQFESDFIELLRHSVTPSLKYTSLLRPLSEVGIAQLFAKTDRYDSVFTSCNKAYSATRPMVDKRWCGECPKCLFVFLSLATATTPQRMQNIFGKNLLDVLALEDGYRALCGLAGQKPWECVGEILESAAALYVLSMRDEWESFSIIQILRDDLVRQYGADTLQREYDRALTPAPAPTLSAEDRAKLERYAQ